MSSSLMSVAVDGTVGAVAEMTFAHSHSRNATSLAAAPPICARWDAVSGGWTADGCVVAAANETHTTCKGLHTYDTHNIFGFKDSFPNCYVVKYQFPQSQFFCLLFGDPFQPRTSYLYPPQVRRPLLLRADGARG